MIFMKLINITFRVMLIAVNIRGHDATARNIEASKEFGVNIAAEDHNVICSIAGRYSGRNVDKISILKESGIASFYDAKQIIQYFGLV
jgi:flavin reductase (DIM6/NTAB) family NADH-FMN oxidoreductase RutF